eukprot:CAMPEP_0116566542 /NCGR_PEP_ID=MMETSP0397-20121206/14519_1 /TAXON_ID=216820 /ORGANISM="Cyclophora tenuis, Strain ECT3854" /LENGTH=361 /DNA_ID=CAMNT_0004093453 /DNA_START=119 /DNA_END=1205 /DNA_ORIENTATION=-
MIDDGEEVPGVKRKPRRGKNELSVETSRSNEQHNGTLTPTTAASTPSPSTPQDVRGENDLRSPGMKRTPRQESQELPDFITQTDRFGNATTPRTRDAVHAAKKDGNEGKGGESEEGDVDPCETVLDSIRLMCCCLLPEENQQGAKAQHTAVDDDPVEKTREQTIRLLPDVHPVDHGKKCLVLDLDETLVHSSFRAVPGADFVIPVQIEDVVHFVYVAKRPGVDEFLVEMAKHYEIVIYTASLNKYADPLLDLLDPCRVIRARLFRESCVYHEGNYVKDMSLLNRDLSQSIIVDNSPSSYLFHPENAIDCSSFIDDPQDRELDQIGAFLTGIKDVEDVRNLCSFWREWPHVEINIESPEDQE